MRTNWQNAGIQNPVVGVKQRTIRANLYCIKHGEPVLFHRRATLKRGGFGRYYWFYNKKKLCAVHKKGERWYISQTTS